MDEQGAQQSLAESHAQQSLIRHQVTLNDIQAQQASASGHAQAIAHDLHKCQADEAKLLSQLGNYSSPVAVPRVSQDVLKWAAVARGASATAPVHSPFYAHVLEKTLHHVQRNAAADASNS